MLERLKKIAHELETVRTEACGRVDSPVPRGRSVLPPGGWQIEENLAGHCAAVARDIEQALRDAKERRSA